MGFFFNKNAQFKHHLYYRHKIVCVNVKRNVKEITCPYELRNGGNLKSFVLNVSKDQWRNEYIYKHIEFVGNFVG